MTITRVGQLTAELRTLLGLSLAPIAAAPSISSAQAQSGTYSYAGATNTTAFGLVVPGTYTAYRTGYWFRHNGTPVGVNGYLYAAADGDSGYESATLAIRYNGVTNQLQLVQPAAGTANNLVVIAETPAPNRLLKRDRWLHVGITHQIDQFTGYISLYLDGVLAFTYTGDTRLFGQGGGVNYYSSNPTRIWGAGYWADFSSATTWVTANYVDDMTIDSYEGEADAPVPARYFTLSLPDGNGADSGWTGSDGNSVNNYLLVDENPNNGDTDYVVATSAGLRDTYTVGNQTPPAEQTIEQVVVVLLARRTDAADSQVRATAYDGVTYADGADLALTTSYAPVHQVFATQPDGSPWNITDFNAMQFGCQSRGTF